jgi:energy-coupling factor transporter ATP-binding protein EcfA2
MPETTIRAEHLSKRYPLGETLVGSYGRLTDAIAGAARRPFRGKHVERHNEYVDALDDVSFEIHEGEAVGFVGPNGASKSTLFKVLARITEPTRGQATLRGRVGSLLEVGTGPGLPDVLSPSGDLTCVTAPLGLTAGRCYVNVFILKSGGKLADKVLNATVLDVVEADPHGLGVVPDRSDALFTLDHRWMVGEASSEDLVELAGEDRVSAF